MKIHFLNVLMIFFTGVILQAAVSGLDKSGHLQAIENSKDNGFFCAILENGVQLHVNGIVKNVIFYGPSTVRVNENLGRNYWEHPSIAVVGKPAAVPFKVQDTADYVAIVSETLQIQADKKTGALM
ncbi:MAG: hypothetical protein ABFD91_11660, partial [Anaerohalosphaeraceae bacterium]